MIKVYVHCHSCGWSQDDFYSMDGYNPTSFLKSLNKDLCGDIDRKIRVNDGKTETTMRKYIAKMYEDYARRIRKMKWVTYDKFRNDPDKICPICGSTNLDLD